MLLLQTTIQPGHLLLAQQKLQVVLAQLLKIVVRVLPLHPYQ